MRFRILCAALICLLLQACSLNQGQGTAPTPQAIDPTSLATTQPIEPEDPTPETEATVAPTDPTTSATSAPASQASYERASCKFEEPDGVEVECGYLIVPEDRSSDDGKTIRLHVAVFKSQSDTPEPDPIVYLEGGPGGNALEGVPLIFEDRFATFLDKRDLIMFDQRGTGYSEPALDCPEIIKLQNDTLTEDIRIPEGEKLGAEALLACRDRLVSEGVNLAAYTSAENAADLNDLRIALGYEQWNLYGISYGTRLALTEMRDFPEGVRSAILDSSYPLETNLFVDIPANADRAFTTFFEGCAKDSACNTAYPNLESDFYKLVDKLNATPVTVPVTNYLTNEESQLLLNGDSLFSILFGALYVTDYIPLLPKAIGDALNSDNYTFLAALAFDDVIQAEFFSNGMYYSVECAEEYPFGTPQAYQNADQSFPEQRDAFDSSSIVTICGAWGSDKPDPRENQPITSDIPSLVLSGEYDPITPPAYNRQVAQSLNNSFLFEFPGLGHGVSNDTECPLGITKAFLDNPSREPDASCIEEMTGPQFVAPDGPITLKPFEDQDFGFSSVLPDTWQKFNDGVYGSRSGNAVIFQFAGAGDQDAVLERLNDQLQLDGEPEAAGQHKGQTLTWQLYTVSLQGQPGNLALATSGDRTYIVLLVGASDTGDSLYDSVFIPTLDVFAPLS